MAKKPDAVMIDPNHEEALESPDLEGEAANSSPRAVIEVVPSTTTAKEDLAYAQGLRKQLLSTFGGHVPEDRSDKVLMIQLLDGMDRQAINLTRISVDEGIANKQAAAAGVISSLIARGLVGDTQVPGTGSIPELPGDVPLPDIVFGELDQAGGSNAADTMGLNYQAFMHEMKAKEDTGK